MDMVILLFLLSLITSNVLVTYIDPVPVWPGIVAPAGVYLVALTLVLRDLVQRRYGLSGTAWAFAGGVLLSYVLSSAQVVSASLAAFVVSFLVDTLVFWLVCVRLKRPLWLGALLSGLISLVPDTVIFLGLLHLEEYIPGQLIGKALGTLAYVVVLLIWEWRERKAQASVPVPSE